MQTLVLGDSSHPGHLCRYTKRLGEDNFEILGRTFRAKVVGCRWSGGKAPCPRWRLENIREVKAQ